MNIFVLSSMLNRHKDEIVNGLRGAGFDVLDPGENDPQDDYNGFHWSFIDPAFSQWSPKQTIMALDNPLAVKDYDYNMALLDAAHIVILVLPANRGDFMRAAFAAASGTLVFVYSFDRFDPELYFKMFGGVFWTSHDLIEAVKKRARLVAEKIKADIKESGEKVMRGEIPQDRPYWESWAAISSDSYFPPSRKIKPDGPQDFDHALMLVSETLEAHQAALEGLQQAAQALAAQALTDQPPLEIQEG